jgi:hypothetical protein
MSAFSHETIAENTRAPLSRRMFDKYDADRNGYISPREFKAMVKDQGIYLTDTALDIALRQLDHDGDKKITYEEFLRWKGSSAFENLALDDSTLQQRLYIAETFDRCIDNCYLRIFQF